MGAKVQRRERELEQGGEADHYVSLKPLLLSIAYRMLGSIADAEDMIHDIFLAAYDIKPKEIRNTRAYLCKMTVNRCINELNSAGKRRELYFGEWLPEPLIADDGPAELAEAGDSLSYAFLVMLDILSPAERAVFLLRSVFEYEYAEIADILDKSEAHCRKLFSRANKQLREAGASLHNNENRERGSRRQLLEDFVAAFRNRDVPRLLSLLSADAVLITDGGGRVRAAVNPIYSRQRVAILLDVIAKNKLGACRIELVDINGRTEIVFWEKDSLVSVMSVELDANAAVPAVRRLYCQMNPDKLKMAASHR